MDNPDLLAAGGGRRRRGRDRPARGLVEGHLVPQPRAATARCCRSCTSTAPRSPARPCWAARTRPRCAPCSRATATTSSRSRAPTCPACTTASPRRWPRRWRTDPRPSRQSARDGDWDGARPRWPMIVLRSPKGWTGPRRGRRRARSRAPSAPTRCRWPASGRTPRTSRCWRTWLRSYRPEELFDADGRAAPSPVPRPTRPATLRMSATPHANGGLLTRDLDLPDLRDYAVDVPRPGDGPAESTRRLGEMLRDVYAANPDRFRLFCPDETNSNRLGAVFEVSDRAFAERVTDDDVALSRDGRVMEVLSEHNCHGWLEGYTLTGRHGLFATYEAFAMVSASQTIQHASGCEEADAARLAGAGPQPQRAADLDRLAQRPQRLQPPGPRPDPERDHHRGHGRPGLPPAGRQLPAVRGRPLPAVTLLRQPDRHRQAAAAAVPRPSRRRSRTAPAGAGVWEWAGTDDGIADPDIVLACAGDVVDDGDGGGGADPARAAARTSAPAWSTWST